MKIAVARLVVIIAMYVLTYYLAVFFGMAYGYIFPKSLGGGSLIPVAATEWFRGVSLALVFLVTVSLNTLSGKNKWWWVGISLIPAVLFEVFIDPLHLYVPIVLGVIAWWLGNLANKALHKLVPGVMAKIG